MRAARASAHGWPFARALGVTSASRPPRRSAQPQIRLDELGAGREIGVLDPAGLTSASHCLEVLTAASGRPRAELEVAERCDRPQLDYRDTRANGRLAPFGRVRARVFFASLPRLEPREAAEPECECDALPGLARQGNAFAVAGVGRRPIVRRGPVARHVDEQLRQRAERRSAADELERALVQAPTRLRLAQPQRAECRPHDEMRIVAQLV